MARTARIALVQLPAYSIEDAAESLEHTLARIDDAAREKPDVIALPEGTYPAYFLGTDHATSEQVLPPKEAMERFAAKAREHGVYIAVGMALDAPGGGLTNGAALFGRDGSLVGRYDKSFLWHFDARWFTPGDAFPVFDTDVGRVGMLVCADGRLPEIARSLVVNGAQIILDLTAWTSTGRHAADLTTIQREFLMPARAAENGVWIACAGKFGVEAESLVYCGRSCFINPRGEYVASLGSDEDAVLTYGVPIDDSRPPIMRRPEMYDLLTHPTESLPVARAQDEAIVMRENERRIAVVQASLPADGTQFVEFARTHVERLVLQDADIALFPATPSRLRGAYDHDGVVRGMSDVAATTGVAVAFTVSEGDGGSGRRVMYLIGPRGIMLQHYQTHKPPGPRFENMPLGDEPCPVANTHVGRVGLMIAAEGFVPEVARSLMLRGAELLLWSADTPGSNMRVFARTRAEENRVYVACAAAASADGGALIVDPSGTVLAEALEGRTLAVAATMNRALTQIKARAPGTDVVRNRQPGAYAALTRQAVAETVL